jgi:rubrerythrin
MSTSRDSVLVDAVKMAMKAERDAAAYYVKASEGATESRAKDMFRQLASFENSHHTALASFLKSLNGGSFAGYEGTSFAKNGPPAPSSPLSPAEVKSSIEALAIAIESEKAARDAYLRLAISASEPKVADFFNRLASEEGLHRKVLEDQFYALSNKGAWTWGE